MFNYAYLIGNAIRMGVDNSDINDPKRKEDHEMSAAIGDLIHDAEPTEVITLWKRSVLTKSDAYVIQAMIERKFESSAVIGKEWLKTDPATIKFFKGLQDNPDWADQWCDKILNLRFRSPRK